MIKTIENYPNYCIMDNGTVLSKIKTCMLKGKITKFGYKTVKLYNKGDSRDYFIHRLVAEAFIPNIENKPFINHKDGNKLNNNINNLEWVTCKENTKHAIDTNLRTVKGEGNNNCKYSDSDIKEMRNIFKDNQNKTKARKEIMRKFGIGKGYLSEILNNNFRN